MVNKFIKYDTDIGFIFFFIGFTCLLGDCVSKEKNACVGLPTTTLSTLLIMHLNDTLLIA